MELSYLAQKVSEFDRLSPYTWCVVGNCFSLQKEHETALRFFQVLGLDEIKGRDERGGKEYSLVACLSHLNVPVVDCL